MKRLHEESSDRNFRRRVKKQTDADWQKIMAQVNSKMRSLQEDNNDQSSEDIFDDFANITMVISDESDLEDDNLSDLDCECTCSSNCDVEDEIFNDRRNEGSGIRRKNAILSEVPLLSLRKSSKEAKLRPRIRSIEEGNILLREASASLDGLEIENPNNPRPGPSSRGSEESLELSDEPPKKRSGCKYCTIMFKKQNIIYC